VGYGSAEPKYVIEAGELTPWLVSEFHGYKPAVVSMGPTDVDERWMDSAFKDRIENFGCGSPALGLGGFALKAFLYLVTRLLVSVSVRPG
jgi:hypothetical protein